MSVPKRRTVAKRRAVTTRRSDRQPIAQVGLANHVFLKPRPPDRAPMSGHPLPSGASVQIEYRFVNRDGSDGKRGSFPYTGAADASFDVTLTREEYANAKDLLVWGAPYGHVALYSEGPPTDTLGYGRVSYDVTSVPLNPNGPTRGQAQFHVLKSVVWYIVDEMNRNRDSATVRRCREAHENAATNERRAANAALLGGPLAAAPFLALAARYHSEALATFAAAVRTGAPWDHKTPIGRIWGANNRLGDVEHSYFYDVWSNIHFGYIGNSCGFRLLTLQTGADIQNLIDNGWPDPKEDRQSVAAGYNLYRAGRDVSVGDVMAIVNAHPDWRSDRRGQ
jgi:hypothetical protein